MADLGAGTDLGFGLAVVFGTLAVLGAAATTTTSYLAAVGGNHETQLLSGVAVGLAMLFGGLAIAALHVYGERGRKRTNR